MWVNTTIGGEYDSTGGSVYGLAILGASRWRENWYYDPQLSVLLTDQNSPGDGGSSNNLLPLISLSVIALVIPLGALVIVGILAYYWIRRWYHRPRAEGAVFYDGPDNL